MKRFLSLAIAVVLVLGIVAASGFAQAGKGGAYSKQLYVEVSALNSLEYFYDHKEGMRLVGEDLGVQHRVHRPGRLRHERRGRGHRPGHRQEGGRHRGRRAGKSR